MIEITTETAIIGGGQAGVPLARALAAASRPVALIESMHLGGSCVNFGCTPSKAVIASARLAADARRAATMGIRIPTVEIDFLAVMDRARDLVARSKGELDASFAGTENPRFLAEHGRLDGQEEGLFRIRAGQTLMRARRVVLNTGTRTAQPAIPGLDQVPVINAENWIALREPPRHLLILGGSYIALEMAQSFRRLGCAVTVLQKGGQLAEREDPDVAAVLHAAIERDGCRVHLNADVQRIEPAGPGVRLHLSSGSVEGTHLFVATGRRPNTDELGLETVGVQLDEQGHVLVNNHLGTNVPNLWAAGDIRGGPAFTHTAYDDFRVLQSQFLGDGSDSRCRIVPYAMFTDPELGRVGLSEAEARKAGKPFKVGRQNMTDSGKARELGKTDGFIKVIVDAETDTILGATALCEQGAEVVQLFVELMNTGGTVAMVRDAIHIHPTLAEAAKNAVLAASSD
ncbi:FAD-dependent oxidoreductase [Rhodopila sp.]|uniref:FAD-dependent oxidoreductase n=1 Tax=Rhodopila sp. TaxID=2480087 RepID=UPI003D0EE78E